MIKDLRWLLWLAWGSAWTPLWIVSSNLTNEKYGRPVVFLLGVILVGFGLYVLNRSLDPTYISDAQLCSNAISHAQRMRDFYRERQLQENQLSEQYAPMIDKAITQEEKTNIYKQRAESLGRFLDRRQYDYENYLLPQAKYLRQQLLLRLPPQPQSVLEPDEAVFMGVGVGGIRAAADRLEVLAKTLCP
jgi:hypothetical protein